MPARGTPGVNWVQQDLETGDSHIEAGAYQAIVVVNYLHRPGYFRRYSPDCATGAC